MKAHLNKIKYTVLNQCTKDDRNDDKLFLESQISDLSVYTGNGDVKTATSLVNVPRSLFLQHAFEATRQQ